MNKNVLIVLAGGALVAILVAVLVSAVVGGGKKGAEPVQQVQQVPQVKVLVASQNISPGNKLNEENIEWKSWPQNGVFPGMIKRKGDQDVLEAISGRMKYPVSQGEPINKEHVLEGDAGFVSASLGPGMRAVSVKVGVDALAGGFIGAGDYVDILMSYSQTIKPTTKDKEARAAQLAVISKEHNRFATETIMQNIKVLAVDQTAVKDEEKAVIGKTVTLEVTPRQAEILIVAKRAGDITLALRGLGDVELYVMKEPVATDERLTSIYDEILEELMKSSSGGNAQKAVRIYDGPSRKVLGVR